jgi:hypothetical protein
MAHLLTKEYATNMIENIFMKRYPKISLLSLFLAQLKKADFCDRYVVSSLQSTYIELLDSGLIMSRDHNFSDFDSKFTELYQYLCENDPSPDIAYSHYRCVNCFDPGRIFCDKCHAITYCNEYCLQLDYARHQEECHKLRYRKVCLGLINYATCEYIYFV